jgi:Putative adhesin
VTAPTRTPPRLLIAVAVVFVLVVAVTGAASLVSQGFRTTSEFTRTLTPQADRLTVHNDKGDVVLLPSRDGLVHVAAESQHGISEPRVSAESTGGGVVLAGSCDSDLAVECTVDFTVQVPASFAVQVQVGAGEVTAADLSGPLDVQATSSDVVLDNLSGPVSVRSESGPVLGRELRSDTVDVLADSGDVSVMLVGVPSSVQARSTRGDVEVVVPGTETYRISTAVPRGSTEIAVADDAGSTHAITASSDLGDVSVMPFLRGPRFVPFPPEPPQAPGAVQVFPGRGDGPQVPDAVRVFPEDADQPRKLPG